ncbi:polysaccharide biosynthesis protein [Staphylococcus gallinarum]|uniref:Polysaccharide biosynthesis protein n=1 Tax=Staphylococcus gallinarum TaxID=1293 RepID=A0A380FDQ6_STAGA|nr:polysaccharide biosynthesis protein [Staphylococcus gallinarum]
MFIAFIIGIICKVLLNILLIPQLLMLGGSVSTVLSLIVFVILLHYQVLKHYKISINDSICTKVNCNNGLVNCSCTMYIICHFY